jgi:hypothetical protein
VKKKLHNGKRSKKGKSEESKPVEDNISNDSPASAPVSPQRTVDFRDPADTNQEQADETMIKHLQVTLRMLEGRKFSRSEVLQLIKEMRQHSIDIENELGYLGPDPKNKPG